MINMADDVMTKRVQCYTTGFHVFCNPSQVVLDVWENMGLRVIDNVEDVIKKLVGIEKKRLNTLLFVFILCWLGSSSC